jgi:hypothetical protein
MCERGVDADAATIDLVISDLYSARRWLVGSRDHEEVLIFCTKELSLNSYFSRCQAYMSICVVGQSMDYSYSILYMLVGIAQEFLDFRNTGEPLLAGVHLPIDGGVGISCEEILYVSLSAEVRIEALILDHGL